MKLSDIDGLLQIENSLEINLNSFFRQHRITASLKLKTIIFKHIKI